MDEFFNELGFVFPDVSYRFNPELRDKFVLDVSRELHNGARVIDISSGSRPYKYLFSHCVYVSHEFEGNKGIVDSFRGESGEKIHDIYSPIERIPVGDNEFDLVICTEVFEHIPEPIEAMRELVRICKIGGRILITAPFTSGIHQEPYHFYSGFSPYFYNYLAGKYNLLVSRFKSQGDMFLLNVQELDRCREVKHPKLLENSLYNRMFDRMVDFMKRYYFGMSRYLGMERYDNVDGMGRVVYGNSFGIGYCVLFEKKN